jgi:hypothetical protein
MKDCTDRHANGVTDIPYFEGDFWTSTMEDLIKELDTEEEDRRKFEELEAVKASDDGCFDDSIEPEEPTEVRQITFYAFTIIHSLIIDIR